MQAAAILAGLSDAERTRIDSFAVPFGVLFQLMDDYSDYFVNTSASNNRPKYRDYRQGKITYPLYLGLTISDDTDVAFIRDHLGDKELSDESIQHVIAILEQNGARDTCRQHIQTYVSQTQHALDELSMSSTSKQTFRAMLARYEP